MAKTKSNKYLQDLGYVVGALFVLLAVSMGASAQQYGIQPIQPYQPLMQYQQPQFSAPRTYFGADGSMTTITESQRLNQFQPRTFTITEIPGHGRNDGRFNARQRILTEPDVNSWSTNPWGWNQ